MWEAAPGVLAIFSRTSSSTPTRSATAWRLSALITLVNRTSIRTFLLVTDIVALQFGLALGRRHHLGQLGCGRLRPPGPAPSFSRSSAALTALGSREDSSAFSLEPACSTSRAHPAQLPLAWSRPGRVALCSPAPNVA